MTSSGHAAGDALLRRAGEVLGKLAREAESCGAHRRRRVRGADAGDRPGGGEATIAQIQKLVELNNQFYSGPVLGLSMGAATSQPGERLETVVKRADLLMYEAKREFYSAAEADRRRRSTGARP